MEYGFCVAGEPLVHENKGANAVRPPKGKTDEHLLPVQGDESGDPEVEGHGEGLEVERDEMDNCVQGLG